MTTRKAILPCRDCPEPLGPALTHAHVCVAGDNDGRCSGHWGAEVITLTETPAYNFYEQFVKTPRRVFIEWEDEDA